jgi:transposase-like protein
MNVHDEARAILATLPRPEPEPERYAADTEPEHEPEQEPEQPVQLADTADLFPEHDEPGAAEPSREQLRQEAARMVLESGFSVRQAASETGLSPSAVQRAVRAAQRNGTDATIEDRVPEQHDGDAELPPNFKSVAALIRSYDEAQRWGHRLAQQNAEIRRENHELREQLGQAVQLLAELKRAGVIA